MKRFKETKIISTHGIGKSYRISLVDSFKDNVQVLTTYTPQEKERLDLIADKFYGDSSKWFVIARANNEVKGTLYATPGKSLVIPRID
jgi:nucleoid-associated protein YgaU